MQVMSKQVKWKLLRRAKLELKEAIKTEKELHDVTNTADDSNVAMELMLLE
jgi:hypothetical protein